ncbi:MAG TPA: class I SAM-dependent methyltransferase [Chitinophagaceae bacterium]
MTLISSNTVDFKTRYLDLREKEGRIYTDEELLHLPVVPKSHAHYAEWRIRKHSSKKLINYLSRKQSLIKILEVGCGNGWLSRRLAEVQGSTVIGADINFTELQQGARVFSHISNLHFIYGDIRSGIFETTQFDCILFASSIQYFPSLTEIISHALKLLRPNGEIHILDSPFYKPGEVEAARQRSTDHFTALGFPELINYYSHHTTKGLSGFEYKTLYQPGSLSHFIFQPANPFPWYCIKGNKM